MAFGMNLNTSNADITPIVKYDARAGRIQRVDREDGVSVPHDVTAGFRAVFDLENVETGWITFTERGPDFHLVPLNSPLPPKPSDLHRQGIRLMLKLHASCGGDVRELATVARSALMGLDELHTAYLAEAGQHPGQLPVVTLKEVRPVVTGTGATKSTNYTPVFVIEGWVPRPADLVHKPRGSSPLVQAMTAGANGLGGNGAAGFKTLEAPPSTGGTKVAAPVASGVSSSDFG